MSSRTPWSREQLFVAFSLYTRLPFGQFHRNNKEVIKYAGLIGRTPSALAMKLCNIASLDPVITDSGRVGLTSASKTDKAMWAEMNSDWALFWQESELAVEAFTTSEVETTAIAEAPANYTAEDHIVSTKARRGQASFRQAVLSAYEERCCITGIENPKLLIASHIAPWAQDKNNRLNPHNGLCLSALHDKAFDSGLITLDENYEVVLSSALASQKGEYASASFETYEGRAIKMPSKFSPSQEFLRFHREQVFIR